MLNEFLKVAYEKSTKQQEQAEFVRLLKELPMEELRKIAETGEIKEAFCGIGGDDAKSWLDQFKGTPFMEQAIGLEQELLQAEMANQQRSQVEGQRSQQAWAQTDQIRLKKRLLELQKAKGEMGTLQQAGMPVSGNLPGETAAGPSAAPPQDMGKTASLPSSLRGEAGFPTKKNPSADIRYRSGDSRVGDYPKELQTKLREHAHGRARAMGIAKGEKLPKLEAAMASKSKILGKAVNGEGLIGQAKDAIKSVIKHAAEASIESADATGRLMAQQDMAKAAHQIELLAVGDKAGRILAKTAGFGAAALRMAERNPGMVIGAGLGAVHGATKQDGGIGSAIGEGLTGAAAGHAVGGVGRRMLAGQEAGQALKGYGRQVVREGKVLGGRAQHAFKDATKDVATEAAGT